MKFNKYTRLDNNEIPSWKIVSIEQASSKVKAATF